MFLTSLTAVFRTIRKNAVFSLINLFGLTLGITSFILIMLFVFSELSYDRYNEKAGSIYRLCIRAAIGDTKINQTYSSSRMFREMLAKYPEIETGVKLFAWRDVLVRVGDETLKEPVVMYVDSTVFNVFTMPLLSGDPANALKRPNTLVISESAARKYFGNQDPVGKIMEVDTGGFGQFEVTGVYSDIPENSHFHADIMASLNTFRYLLRAQEWTANNFITYFLLRPNASAKDLETKFRKYTMESVGEENYKKAAAKGNFWEFYLQPLTSIHLHSDLNGELEPNGNVKYVYVFIVIALFVLIIACINFMNLSIAKSMLRAREVGIKKTAGSTRLKLILQFLSESVIFAFVSLILAIIIVQFTLPAYNAWLGRELSLSLFANPWTLPGLVAFGLVVGIIAGTYPAFVLSSFNPVKVLKSQVLSESRGMGLRSILVIVQFSASIFLIISTLVISSQINLILNKDVGFTKENILILRTPSSFGQVRQAFTDEISQYAGVKGISASSSLPGFSFPNWGFGAEGVEKSFTLNLIRCDTAFLNTMRFRMAEGRFFSPDFPTDSSGIILNETAVKVIGLKSPIGTKMFGGGNSERVYHVIGVVRDFNYESVHSEIRPMGLVNLKNRTGNYLSIRVDPGKSQEITALAKGIWEKMLPGTPFSYSFMQDDYVNQYKNEIQTKQVFAMLTALAVIVAILGLLGLASFMAQRRVREIAIRKISGAGVDQIIGLLTWKFIKWVLISFAIASPVAWWVMERWLRDFAYRITINPWVFILSGGIAVVLVVMTVGLITYRAATANPAESMKYE